MDAVSGNKSFTINEWRVEPALNRLSRADEVIKIDPQHMKVLELLASRPGEVISQSDIEQAAWSDVIVTPNSVYQSIAQLRRALGDDRANPKYIETIARKGYRMVATIAGSSCHAQEGGTKKSTRFRSLRVIAPLGSLTVLAILVPVVVAHVQRPNDGHSSTTPADNVIVPIAYQSATESQGHRAERLLSMGDAAIAAGRPREAQSHYQEALRLVDEFVARTDPVRAEYLAKIADVHLWSDDSEKAASVAREALRILETSAPEMHPTFVRLRRTLGYALIDLERYSDAEFQLLAALRLSRALYGELDMDTLDAKDSLAILYGAQQKWEEAEKLARNLLEQHLRVRGANETKTAYFRTRLAYVLYSTGKYDSALEEVNAALTILARVTRADHPFVGSAQQILADALVRTGAYREAEIASSAALRIWQENDSKPWRSARAASTLGESLLEQGRFSEAEQHLAYAARILNGQKGYAQQRAIDENVRRLSKLEAAQRAALVSNEEQLLGR